MLRASLPSLRVGLGRPSAYTCALGSRAFSTQLELDFETKVFDKRPYEVCTAGRDLAKLHAFWCAACRDHRVPGAGGAPPSAALAEGIRRHQTGVTRDRSTKQVCAFSSVCFGTFLNVHLLCALLSLFAHDRSALSGGEARAPLKRKICETLWRVLTSRLKLAFDQGRHRWRTPGV